MHYKIVPDVVRDQKLAQVPETMTVREAASLMAGRHIGAVMVMDGQRLIGIFTERDLMSRVVAPGLDPNTTKLAQVMTRDPDTIDGDASALDALQMMRRSGYRHLPVAKQGRIVGIISVRDLYGTVITELEEDLKDRDAFIQGTTYGLGH
jgi:CBS domain-containing protein